MVEVSIIMPTFNCENYLAQSISSVLQQSFTHFEFIIINDHSTDQTNRILRKFAQKDPRIRIFTNDHNIGVARSLNRGIKYSQGKYIARIDSDDIWEKNKLELQMDFFHKHPESVFLHTDFVVINNEGEIDPRYKWKSTENILIKNYICHSSVIFSKEIIKQIGYYNETYKNAEDYEFWIRIFSKLKRLDKINIPLVKYRIHPNMISRQREKEMIFYTLKAKIYGYQQNGFKIKYFHPFLKDLFKLILPISFLTIFRKK